MSERDAWYNLGYDAVIKFVIIGQGAVGKSSLMRRYAEGVFVPDDYASTIGVDFKRKVVVVPDNNYENARRKDYYCKLQIWDTAGQERFRSITRSYYKGSKICIVCFDTTSITGLNSIHGVESWLYDVKDQIEHDSMIYVLGTKFDCTNGVGDHITDDFYRCIKRWNKFKKVKFAGWCSSKQDIFLPFYPEDYLNQIPDETFRRRYGYDNIYCDDPKPPKPLFKGLMGQRQGIDTKDKDRRYSVDAMFKAMLVDYLDSAMMKEPVTETVDLNRQIGKKSCCTIL